MGSSRVAFAAVAVAIALSGLLSGCGQNGNRQMPPPEVGVVIIRPRSATLTAELPGRTVPYAISDIRPQVSGIILKRLFTEGSDVKAGQILYQIDPAPYRAAYDNAIANLASTKALAERYAKLIKFNAISLQSYDNAEAAYKQAAATVETARINLNYTRLTAPISGRIGMSSVTEGALVTASQTTALTTIQTLNPIYVDMPQSSTQLLALRQAIAAGQIDAKVPAVADVSLLLEDGTKYPLPGKLQFTDITVDPTTGAVMLRALVPNPHDILLPGMYVRAEIREGVVPKAILAPQQGVTRDTKGEPVAWVVGKDNKAEMRTLQVSRAVGNDWLVTAGLKDGDRLIVQGTQNVRPGVVVRPLTVSLTDPKPASDTGR